MKYITLRQEHELIEYASLWFSSKWGIPTEEYYKCMNDYIKGYTELGWYLCIDDDKIVGGLGVIENDFHDRPDLCPNICAVYTEEKYRCRGIAGILLNMCVEDLRNHHISPVYLLTEHTSFYEKYGFEYFCQVQGDGEDHTSRMYIHK